MFTLSRHRRLTTWFALWLLVLTALLPVAAQAMVTRQQGGEWLEVCTSTGMVRVAPDAADSAQSASTDGQTGEFNLGQHCPLCTLHDATLALPPVAFQFQPVPALADFPPAYYRSVQAASVWLAAPARAPPRL